MAAPGKGSLNDEVRERLRKHFLTAAPSDHPDKWSDLWLEKFLPWDKGSPSPALIDLLSARGTSLLELAPGKTALVPGCGRGYDVHLFASYGLKVWGLDYSPEAIARAKEWAEMQTVGHPEGAMEFIQADFFEHDREGGYDCIYDYTFLCALPPELRGKWAAAMKKLVKKEGYLVCLEFPLYKDPATGGPPWGLKSEVYVEFLEGEFERVVHFMPERTHDVGERTDWMSVWKRK